MALLSLSSGMVQEKAPVLIHRRIAADHYLMRLKSSTAARRARPGQFVHVRCQENGEGRGRSLSGAVPLLRRPLSLLDANPQAGTIDFIYKVVGLGTKTLSQIPTGARVDFIGPLGRPFEITPVTQACILVGGGVGIPPLCLLAKWLLRQKRRVIALLGARTKGWVICVSDFRKLGVPVHVATDDGSAGYRGSVVELLQALRVSSSRRRGSGPRVGGDDLVDSRLRGNDKPILYICGPTPMMAAAAAVAHRKGIHAQVSLEERMGCAMGCCMGCVVEVTTEPASAHARFQRVCTEGPVFQAEAIAW